MKSIQYDGNKPESGPPQSELLLSRRPHFAEISLKRWHCFREDAQPVPVDRLSAAYLKCNAEMAVSVPPYLTSSLTLDGEMIRRLARRSFACLRRIMIPCSISLANLRRTVARELIFSSKSRFSVSGCSCSSAYPISMTISKSTMDLRKGSCRLSNFLIFFNPVNIFMTNFVFIFFFRLFPIVFNTISVHFDFLPARAPSVPVAFLTA